MYIDLVTKLIKQIHLCLIQLKQIEVNLTLTVLSIPLGYIYKYTHLTFGQEREESSDGLVVKVQPTTITRLPLLGSWPRHLTLNCSKLCSVVIESCFGLLWKVSVK